MQLSWCNFVSVMEDSWSNRLKVSLLALVLPHSRDGPMILAFARHSSQAKICSMCLYTIAGFQGTQCDESNKVIRQQRWTAHRWSAKADSVCREQSGRIERYCWMLTVVLQDAWNCFMVKSTMHRRLVGTIHLQARGSSGNAAVKLGIPLQARESSAS